jgi:hypothetical protein
MDRLSVIRESRDGKERSSRSSRGMRESGDSEHVRDAPSERSSHASAWSANSEAHDDDDALYEEDFEPHDEENDDSKTASCRLSHANARHGLGIQNDQLHATEESGSTLFRRIGSGNASQGGWVSGSSQVTSASSRDGGNKSVQSAPRQKVMDDVVSVVCMYVCMYSLCIAASVCARLCVFFLYDGAFLFCSRPYECAANVCSCLRVLCAHKSVQLHVMPFHQHFHVLFASFSRKCNTCAFSKYLYA